MPRYRTEQIAVIGRLKGYLRLDAGVGKAVSPRPEERPSESKAGPPRKDGRAAVRNRHALPLPDPQADRIEIFKTLLGPLPPGKLVDLGAGHGKFSIAAQELGWDVTAVDARTVRMPMTEGIEWLESDVRDFDPSGYGCICVLGLFYHLAVEDQLALLRKCAGTLTIVDTHVAGGVEVKLDGYEGVYFDEVPGGTPEERNAKPTASWGNETSFWPTQESFIRMARDCGFSQVSAVLPPHAKNRTFYVLYP